MTFIPNRFAREQELSRRWSALPCCWEVLKNGQMRRVRDRPPEWTDEEVRILEEFLNLDPFPQRSPAEEVLRYTTDAAIERVLKAKVDPTLPKKETPPPLVATQPARNPSLDARERVRQVLLSMAAKVKTPVDSLDDSRFSDPFEGSE